ncbi:hypothetical protein [Algoriphagus sp. PAP.12]|uniref:hypothetical protein n=1 Tax=Algoriphagus sp. PAP.12 TaxID=2996678 RepID=UPI003FA3725E
MQKNKNAERYIYLRITVEGTAKELSTKRLWHSLKWNVSAGRATGKSEASKSLNSYLDTLYYKAMQAKNTP